MALIDKPEFGREAGEIRVPVGQTVECDRDPNSIPKLQSLIPVAREKIRLT
jgi:hypothetical protein